MGRKGLLQGKVERETVVLKELGSGKKREVNMKEKTNDLKVVKILVFCCVFPRFQRWRTL